MQSEEFVIDIQNVTKSFDVGGVKVEALRGVSFKVASGEFVSIMGPSGSGKSTLMNMIGLLDRPTSGKVQIAGQCVATLGDAKLSLLRSRTIGFVFQQYNLLDSMTVIENVMLPLRYQGVKRSLRKERSLEVLTQMGLGERLRHFPRQLSGGQKQRVAIARALVTNPAIILADEPTGALDSSTGFAVMETFRAINKAHTTVVIVTHDERIGRSAGRMIKILDGKIV